MTYTSNGLSRSAFDAGAEVAASTILSCNDWASRGHCAVVMRL